MGPISCLALIALVAVRSGNAVGNCKGQCIPGKTQQGKFSVAVGNLLANLGDLDVFYFANDMELGRYYIKGLDFDSKGDQSSVEALLLYTEVTDWLSPCGLTRCVIARILLCGTSSSTGQSV